MVVGSGVGGAVGLGKHELVRLAGVSGQEFKVMPVSTFICATMEQPWGFTRCIVYLGRGESELEDACNDDSGL